MAKKKKKKWYVVWEGNRPGIYDNWDDASAQVKGYSGAKYKSFESRAAAEQAYGGRPEAHISQRKKGDAAKTKQPELLKGTTGVIWDSIAVDAACSGNPGDLEYRGVDLSSNQQIFIRGPFAQGTNNVGEFLGLVHGLSVLKQRGSDWPIYSDSKIAIGWVRKGKCNTSLKRNPVNEGLFQMIEKAEKWLAENEYSNPILKWETGRWGEIPADFGRK